MTNTHIAVRALLLVLTLCSGMQAALAQTARFTAKIPKAAGNAESLENATMARFAMLVRERTKGAVEIQPLYGPQFGGDAEILQNVRLGSLQGGYVTAAGSSGIVPQSSVLELPFLFRGSDHALAVASGKPVQMLGKYYDAVGLHLCAIWNYGPREPVGTFPVKTMKDFAGKKIRVKESQLAVDMWKLLGANPTPMVWGEVQNAIRTKTIDGYDTTGSAYWDLKLYEAAPHYTYLPLTYVFYQIVFSKDWWNRLPAEYRAIIEQAAAEMGPVTHHLMELEAVRGPERAAASGGAKISRVTDLAPYQAVMKPLMASWAAKVDGGQALIDAITATPDKK